MPHEKIMSSTNEWYQYPHEQGFWWRKQGHVVNVCWVKFKTNIDETETPVYYADYNELGDVIKQAIFEIDVAGVCWQKIKPYIYDKDNKEEATTTIRIRK